jgi:hypothetical protein
MQSSNGCSHSEDGEVSTSELHFAMKLPVAVVTVMPVATAVTRRRGLSQRRSLRPGCLQPEESQPQAQTLAPPCASTAVQVASSALESSADGQNYVLDVPAQTNLGKRAKVESPSEPLAPFVGDEPEGPQTDSEVLLHHWHHAVDPAAFECPCGPCEYDCQKRSPVRSACACKRLLCRKCAGAIASLPGPAPCGLCSKAEAVGPFETHDFLRDVGVLMAMMSRMEAFDAYVLTASASERLPLSTCSLAHRHTGTP